MREDKSAYAAAGVNIDAADRAIELMKRHVQSTHNELVVGGMGHFGGLFDASILKNYRHPILVSSIDGGGTKTGIPGAKEEGTIGQDIVNHCINDILTLRAMPLYFLDYLAADVLEPEVMASIVGGMAVACREAEIPIIAGETAEMPGVYKKGQHDVVGCIIGIVEKDNIIDGSKIGPGDQLLGLASNGLHTNGYSLVRKAFSELSMDIKIKGLDCTLGEELLKVHKSYLPAIKLLLQRGIEIKGMAHITGGGFYDNIGRLLRSGLQARITNKWLIPPVFHAIQRSAGVSDGEMRKVFNLGIGMVTMISAREIEPAMDYLEELGESAIVIGHIEKAPANMQREIKVVFEY